MALSPGDKLGPYEILAPIGKGGMGEVYRAKDTKLKRDVALKVLPEAFANDPERMARFQREAEVLASLNHPNIATIHGVEDRALIMELVQGNTPRGPLRFDEAWKIASQIAAALGYAHGHDIMHRDLKPANIMLTPDGVVKLLDFGLAKAFSNQREPSASSENSPTLTLGATEVGAILGTAAYMAPEQARGRAVDKRADIWAFGVVLYELLTGKRPFQGEDVAHTLAAVIMQEPDLSGAPPEVLPLLKRCLEKDPKKRLRDIEDMELLLVDKSTAVVGQMRSRTSPWIAAGVMTAVAVAALWAPWRSEKPVDHPVTQLDVDLGADISLPAPGPGGNTIAISPDGTQLAYASGRPTRLFIRRLDKPKGAEFPATQGASRPFFSPDGQWVGFLAGTKLNKIAVDGGAVVPLGDFPSLSSASWAEDNSIFASIAFATGLLRIPAGGGPPQTVAGLDTGEIVLLGPHTLPGGKAILFAAQKTVDVDTHTIEVLTLAGLSRKIVARGGSSPRYLATASRVGHLVYVNKATLFAVPFDLDKLETRGTAVPVLDDVAYESRTGVGQYDFSRTGTLIYRRINGGVSALTTVQWIDSAGNAEPLRAKPGAYEFPSLSPDGKRMAFAVTEGGKADVWVYDHQRDAMTRLTFGGAVYRNPRWSPDGQYVVFESLGGEGIFQARADGSSQPKELTRGKTAQIPWSLTPDGRWLAYTEGEVNGQIWTVPLEDQGGQLKAGKPEQFLKSQFSERDAMFSPDGRWLAYSSNESGKSEVYVRWFSPSNSVSVSPGQDRKIQISNSGGAEPRWSRNGHDLLYRSGDQIMAAAYVVMGTTLVSEKPRVWLAKFRGRAWDLAPDGKRLVVVAPLETGEAEKQEHEVVLFQNFFDELRRLAPLGK